MDEVESSCRRCRHVEWGRGRGRPFQVNEERGNVGWVHSADPARLAERTGADLSQLLAGLGAKLADGGIVEVRWKRLLLQAAESFHLLGLTSDVAAVLRLDRHLLDHAGVVL